MDKNIETVTSKSKVLLVFLVLLFGLITFSKFDAAPDLYGHLGVGKQLLSKQALPRLNTYSYTDPDQAWINQYWLAEVIFAAVFQAGGSPALLVFQWLIGSLILLLLLNLMWHQFPGLSDLSLFLALLLGMGLVRFGLNLRPQLFTYLNTVILLQLLADNRIHRRQMIALPLLFLFWVNVHGAVIAGLGLYGLWIVVELLKHRQHAWWFKKQFPSIVSVSGLILLATLINPYGYHLHQFLWQALHVDHSFLMEWQPLDWIGNTNLFFKISLPLWLGLLIYQHRTGHYQDPYYVLISLVTALLAIQHIRHIPFFGITLPLVIAGALNQLFLSQGKNLLQVWEKLQINLNHLNPLIQKPLLIAITLLVLYGLTPATGFNLVTAPDFPVAQVKFLREQGWRGRLLNDYDWGYYLTRELYPAIQIAMDGRYETAYSPTIRRQYLDFILDPGNHYTYLDTAQADLALLRSGSPAAQITGHHKNWVLINHDKIADLFATTAFLRQQQAFDPRLPATNDPTDFLVEPFVWEGHSR